MSSGGGTHASAVDGGDDKKRHRRSSPQARGLLTLAMMVGHAVTDGLVIGSAAATGQQELSLVVAFAMIAHKVPASFSLSMFLFSIKWPTASVLKSMLVFSLSSPLAAVGFYAIKFLVSESDFEKMISWVSSLAPAPTNSKFGKLTPRASPSLSTGHALLGGQHPLRWVLPYVPGGPRGEPGQGSEETGRVHCGSRQLFRILVRLCAS